MSLEQSASVKEYQSIRMLGAPRRWTFWIALFTAINGVLILMAQDLTFLAGFVIPFALPGAIPHFVVAAITAGFAFAASSNRWILILPLSLYAVDTIVAAYFQFWVGVVMHVLVLVLAGIAFMTGRKLSRDLASTKGEPV
jgi:hypothetical protein